MGMMKGIVIELQNSSELIKYMESRITSLEKKLLDLTEHVDKVYGWLQTDISNNYRRSKEKLE